MNWWERALRSQHGAQIPLSALVFLSRTLRALCAFCITISMCFAKLLHSMCKGNLLWALKPPKVQLQPSAMQLLCDGAAAQQAAGHDALWHTTISPGAPPKCIQVWFPALKEVSVWVCKAAFSWAELEVAAEHTVSNTVSRKLSLSLLKLTGAAELLYTRTLPGWHWSRFWYKDMGEVCSLVDELNLFFFVSWGWLHDFPADRRRWLLWQVKGESSWALARCSLRETLCCSHEIQ